MKKIIIGVVIFILSSSVSFADVNLVWDISFKTKKEIKINNLVKKYYKKYSDKYWNEKTIKVFKNLNNKVLKIRKNSSWDKKELLNIINLSLYDIILKNQDNSEKIVKQLKEWIYIKQNKKWLWYTNIYVYWNKIYSKPTFNSSLESEYSKYNPYIYDVDNNDKTVYNLDEKILKEIQKRAFKNIEIFEYKKMWITLLTIPQYESSVYYIIDNNSKKIIFKQSWREFSKLKKWKSWIYFILNYRLYHIDNNYNINILFNWDNKEFIYLLDYELTYNKKIKLFLEKDSWNYEKIITIGSK